jgi:hypothetical protein
MNVRPAEELISTGEKSKSTEPVVNTTEDAGKGQGRSKPRTIAIVVALFVCLPVMAARYSCAFSLLNSSAFTLYRSARRHNRRNRSPYHISRVKLSSRLHMDWRCFSSCQRYIWANLGQTVRHMGKKAYCAHDACSVFRQLCCMRNCKNYGVPDCRTRVPRCRRWWINIVGARLHQRYVQPETA